MDKKLIEPERRDFILAAWMVLCGFFFLEGRIMGEYSALGRAVFILLICAATEAYYKSQGIRQGKESTVALISIIMLGATFVIFAGRTEHIITFAAVIPMYLYWVARTSGEAIDSRLSIYALGDVLKQGFITPFINFGSCPTVLVKSSRDKGGKNALMILVGIIIALPLVICATYYLVQADKTFSDIIENILGLLSWNWLRYIAEIILGIPVAFYIFGLIYGNAKGNKEDSLNKKVLYKAARSMAKVPPVIGSTVLICMNVIYIAFLAVQLRHVVMGLPKDMTYAEFARQGFFDLCKVAVLNFAVVVATSILQKRKEKGTKFSKLQIAIMSVLTIGISGTALTKMFMYISVYGLTQKRIYTSTFMIFLIIVFAAIAIHQFIRINIGKVICITGLILLIAFNYAGVDRTIAKYNISRYEAGTLKMMDMEMMGSLDEGALPEIYKLWKKEMNLNMAELLRRIPTSYAWSSWSIERQRAIEVRDDFYRNYYGTEDTQNDV